MVVKTVAFNVSRLLCCCWTITCPWKLLLSGFDPVDSLGGLVALTLTFLYARPQIQHGCHDISCCHGNNCPGVTGGPGCHMSPLQAQEASKYDDIIINSQMISFNRKCDSCPVCPSSDHQAGAHVSVRPSLGSTPPLWYRRGLMLSFLSSNQVV